MRFKIDGVDVLYPPESIDVVPPGYQEHPTAGGNIIVIEEQGGSTITVNLESSKNEDVMAAFFKARQNFPQHMITLEDIRCHRFININAYMPRLNYNALDYQTDGKIAQGAFSIPFRQITPSPVPTIFELWARGVITVGDSKYVFVAPAAGKLIDVTGFIVTTGSGGGQTDVQIRNDTQGIDYCSTKGYFTAGGAGLLTGAIIQASNSFLKGDEIHLDIDAIPGNSDSATACIQLLVHIFRP